MDLRALTRQSPGVAAESATEVAQGTGSWQALLRAGSAIAAEARAALKVLGNDASDSLIACSFGDCTASLMPCMITCHVYRQRLATEARLALPATKCWQNWRAVCTSLTTRRSCHHQWLRTSLPRCLSGAAHGQASKPAITQSISPLSTRLEASNALLLHLCGQNIDPALHNCRAIQGVGYKVACNRAIFGLG